MVDIAAVRRIAAALPGAQDQSEGERLIFAVADRGFAWSYLERQHPKRPRVSRPDVLVVRCPMERKELLIAAAGDRFFDDDHYRGYQAVLVRLDAIAEDELAELLADACAMQAAKRPRKRS